MVGIATGMNSTAPTVRQDGKILGWTVWVAALGYFVDMFDITLYGVVRTSSLKDIGVTDPAQLLTDGVYLYNSQAIGMMLGGILWGLLADKRGRLSVMFGSILLYSLGNIANAFVTSVDAYALCRFVTGLGLAGELGAAITIVSETLPKEKRGLGTTIVAAVGLSGCIAAAWIGQKMSWQAAYLLGGGMGLALLASRAKMSESGLFDRMRKEGAQAGIGVLFKPRNLRKYLATVLVGVPIYFITGILFTFAPEITQAIGVAGEITAGNALLFGSIGLAAGDLMSGLLSQYLGSRRKAVTVCLLIAFGLVLIYLNAAGATPAFIYALCLAAGLCAGYWAVLVTIAAEQFGTNIRGTVATTVPNFVRGSATLVTLGFTTLKVYMGARGAALTLGGLWFGLALLSLWSLEETFHKELNYLEE